MAAVDERPTKWWLGALRQRAEKAGSEPLLHDPIEWQSDEERRAAFAFFNAAVRAEESGLRQAHELAGEVASWDPDLGEVLRLYGTEEGWHRQLLEEFLPRIGGSIRPMGPVTRTFYRLYARATRMETILLTNLMFETIGATTYRLALRNVKYPAARRMLMILTRDESFHVPLNVHFLRQVLGRKPPSARRRLRRLYRLLYASLVLLPLASRPKARAFDGISVGTLSRAYARELGRVFDGAPELGLEPPRLLLRLLGVDLGEGDLDAGVSGAAAERAARREDVEVTSL
jgi:hypothetical protein